MSVREIVSIFGGGCGNAVGGALWGALCAEHAIDAATGHTVPDACRASHVCATPPTTRSLALSAAAAAATASGAAAAPTASPPALCDAASDVQRAKVGVCFRESATPGRSPLVTHEPRSVHYDVDAGSLDALRGGPVGRLLPPEACVGVGAGGTSTAGNFASGFFSLGAEHADAVLDAVRREAEACDSLQGFQFGHSTGGGTGGGLGAMLLARLRDEYPDRPVMTFSVVPEPVTVAPLGHAAVGPTWSRRPGDDPARAPPPPPSSAAAVAAACDAAVNTVLTLHALLEHASMTTWVDTSACRQVCTRTLRLGPTPSRAQLNSVAVEALCGVTAWWRFPGDTNRGLRQTAGNLVPYPQLHFLAPSLAPLQPPGMRAPSPPRSTWQLAPRRGPGIASPDDPVHAWTVPELHQQIFDAKHFLAECDIRHGRMLSASFLYRGHVAPRECADATLSVTNKGSSYFVEWIPNNLKWDTRAVARPGLRCDAHALVNTTALREAVAAHLTCVDAALSAPKHVEGAETHAQAATAAAGRAHLRRLADHGLEKDDVVTANEDVAALVAEWLQFQDATAYDEKDEFDDEDDEWAHRTEDETCANACR